jgi:hypothetical protein
MAELIVEGPELVVRLSWLEKLAALRGNVRVPPRAARSARVDLGKESPFARLVVSVSDAESTVAAIRSAAGI